MDVKEPKKRIQIQVDKKLADHTEQVLGELGLTPTTAITMLYKRIVAKGGLPFDVSLTDREKASLSLLDATKDLPIKKLDTKEKLEDWFKDEDQDY